MRVLQINVKASGGSVGRIVASIYKECKAQGIESKIAYGRGSQGIFPNEDNYRICSENDVRMHALLSRVFGRTATYSKRSTNRLIEWIRSVRPDIIHLHSAYGYYLNMPLLFDYIAKNDIALVSTLHSCWDFTGHCCFFDDPQCNEWKNGCYRCVRLKDYPEALFGDDTHRNLVQKKELYHKVKRIRIVTPSIWMEKKVRESVLAGLPLCTIHNGINTKVFRKKNINNEDDKPMILCVANIWSERKGLDDVLKLAEMVNGAMNVTVVGLSAAQIASLPKGVTGIQRTDTAEDLVDLYNRATILFNPTREDNYPTVNIEAVSCHLPVVTYDTGGCSETIDNGKYGLIVERGDFKSVIEYINMIVRGDIEIDYSDLTYLEEDTMTRQYIELYRKTLS